MDPCRVPRALHWYAPREPQYFPRILSLRPSPPHSLLLLDDSVGLSHPQCSGPNAIHSQQEADPRKASCEFTKLYLQLHYICTVSGLAIYSPYAYI